MCRLQREGKIISRQAGPHTCILCLYSKASKFTRDDEKLRNYALDIFHRNKSELKRKELRKSKLLFSSHLDLREV